MVATRWLPADTRPPAALDALFAAPVAAWAAHWFADGQVRTPRLERGAGGAPAWRENDAGLAIGMSPDTALAIGAHILGLSGQARDGADRALMESVAEPCLIDLRDRLAALTGGGGASPVTHAPRWSATLRDGLAFGLSDALFAALCVRTLPPVTPVPLGSGAQALAAIGVSVGAAVGRAAMRVADLRALEVGDVVVLDHPLADPVPIVVDGRPLPRGRVRVVPADPAPVLEIVDVAA